MVTVTRGLAKYMFTDIALHCVITHIKEAAKNIRGYMWSLLGC
jgi:hypothetical protein